MPFAALRPAQFTATLFSPRAQFAWWCLLIGQMLLVCVLAFDPMPRGPSFGHQDKLLHLLAFVSLSFTARWALRANESARTVWRSLARPGAAMLAFALFIEAVQAFIPARSASLADVLADAVGIGLGLALAAATGRWLARHAGQTRQDPGSR